MSDEMSNPRNRIINVNKITDNTINVGGTV